MIIPTTSRVNLLAAGLGSAACWLVCLSGAVSAAEAPKPTLQNGNIRLIIVGDSITGNGYTMANGYAHRFEEALKAVYPDSKPEIISLGGSGQTVGSWVGMARRSHDQEMFLNVPTVGIKATLAQPADAVVIMLGMNDILSPSLDGTPESIDKWQQQYEGLIAALRERVHPKLLGLASVSPNTEDPRSPKNQLIDALNARVRALAAKEGAAYLPVSEEMWKLLAQGRSFRPDFHLAGDFVHPGGVGNTGIAIAMLQGLGEPKAAGYLEDKMLPELRGAGRKDALPFSWQLETPVTMGEPAAGAPGEFVFHVKYWWQPAGANPAAGAAASSSTPHVHLNAPAGWKVQPSELIASSGEFTVTGKPDHLQNALTLVGKVDAKEAQAAFTIPAPWLVCAKVPQPDWKDDLSSGKSKPVFDFAKALTPFDQLIESGGDWYGSSDAGANHKLAWQPYFSTVNYAGLDDPGSVDFAAVTHAKLFEGGYGCRWVYSEKERPTELTFGSKIFAGNMALTVWVNGKSAYQGIITDEPQRQAKATATFKQGWNALVFKADHRQWQFHVMVDLAGVNGDPLEDLRFSILPPATSGN